MLPAGLYFTDDFLFLMSPLSFDNVVVYFVLLGLGLSH